MQNNNQNSAEKDQIIRKFIKLCIILLEKFKILAHFFKKY